LIKIFRVRFYPESLRETIDVEVFCRFDTLMHDNIKIKLIKYLRLLAATMPLDFALPEKQF
jgi:hypothetical protein